MMRREFIELTTAGLVGCAFSGARESEASSFLVGGPGEKRAILKGVDRYRVVEPLFEGIRVILSYLGEKYSPSYVQGISGAAFRIGGICPCAPTCTAMMDPKDLIAKLGYRCEDYPLSGDGFDESERLKAMVARTKDEIRKRRPVLVFHAFTNAEWDVVCGFDEEEKAFYGRGSYAGETDYAKKPESRALEAKNICPPLGAIFIEEKTGRFQRKKAEVAALKEAVAHAHSQKNKEKIGGEKWAFLEGELCYDRWVSDFMNDPKRERGAGDSYCFGVYRSAHRAASGFLEEIAPHYPKASDRLKQAADHFRDEADALDRGESLLWWDSPAKAEGDLNLRRGRVLKEARDHYVRAIDEIEAALPSLEA